MKTVNVSDETWQDLMKYKIRDGFASMDDVIKELLKKYCVAYDTCERKEA